MNISHVNPPIPARQFDYCATLPGYEPGDAIGYGQTPEMAAEDLLDELTTPTTKD